MLSTVFSAGICGIDGFIVSVECDAQENMANFESVGLPDLAVREAKERVRTAAEVVDHFFVDIKDMNPEIYKSYTGRDNALVKENLNVLLSLAGAERVTVRVPLIPHYNTEADVERSVTQLTAMGVTLVDRFIYRLPKKI